MQVNTDTDCFRSYYLNQIRNLNVMIVTAMTLMTARPFRSFIISFFIWIHLLSVLLYDFNIYLVHIKIPYT